MFQAPACHAARAGSSALLRQLHPDWTPAQVKGRWSDGHRDARLRTTNPQNIGGGVITWPRRRRPLRARAATLSSARSSRSRAVEDISVTLTNVSSASRRSRGRGGTVAASASGGFGIPVSVTLARVSLRTLNVTVDAAKSAASASTGVASRDASSGSPVAAPLWVPSGRHGRRPNLKNTCARISKARAPVRCTGAFSCGQARSSGRSSHLLRLAMRRSASAPGIAEDVVDQRRTARAPPGEAWRGTRRRPHGGARRSICLKRRASARVLGGPRVARMKRCARPGRPRSPRAEVGTPRCR